MSLERTVFKEKKEKKRKKQQCLLMLKWNKKYLKKTLLPTEVYTSFDYGLSSTVVCSMSVP